MAVASAGNKAAVREAAAPAKPKRLVSAWHLVGLLAIFLFAVFPF